MAVVKSPLTDEVRTVVGQALQGSLVDLIDLSLTAKQAHWNVTGRTFKSVHEQLDELTTTVRAASDSVAERAVMIGVNPDGRVQTVAHETSLPTLEPGWLPEDKVIHAIVDALAGTIARFRERIDAVEADQVTQDLLISITAQLEEHHWMFSVQR
ncbi:Dps family protein [Actinocorallia populi]|uniref:Dps family protein n=1 Tax=Actinocorallia populi TaxID=2079200 RepID=UPI000D097683|nr:DNA starvation/stationary phase protection protein [Actinocorallia populi]